MPQEGDGKGGWVGQRALNQSKGLQGDKEAQKARRRAREKPSGSPRRAPHAPGLPGEPAAPRPLTAEGTAPRPSGLVPSFAPGPTQRKGWRSGASDSAASWFK